MVQVLTDPKLIEQRRKEHEAERKRLRQDTLDKAQRKYMAILDLERTIRFMKHLKAPESTVEKLCEAAKELRDDFDFFIEHNGYGTLNREPVIASAVRRGGSENLHL